MVSGWHFFLTSKNVLLKSHQIIKLNYDKISFHALNYTMLILIWTKIYWFFFISRIFLALLLSDKRLTDFYVSIIFKRISSFSTHHDGEANSANNGINKYFNRMNSSIWRKKMKKERQKNNGKIHIKFCMQNGINNNKCTIDQESGQLFESENDKINSIQILIGSNVS